MTLAEVIICRLYLKDLDESQTSKEYKLMMELLDQEEKKAEELMKANAAGSFSERMNHKGIKL